MKIKIIACVCLSALLLFGVILAQKNNSKNPGNSNALANTSERTFPNNANLSNSNMKMAKEIEAEPIPIACQYLTKADAEKILGRPVYFNGFLTSYIDKNYYCNYTALAKNPPDAPFVRIDIKTFATKNLAQSANTEKIKALKGYELAMLDKPEAGFPKVLNLKGIEKAKLVWRNRSLICVYFQKEKTAFEITVSDHTTELLNTAQLRLVAKKVFKHYLAERPSHE